MTYGKIESLPREIREQLNHRMADGEPFDELVAWLKGLPVVRQLCTKYFRGRSISRKNLSDWKLGGHQEWWVRQETLTFARETSGEVKQLTQVVGGSVAEHLSAVLSTRYARLLSGWGGKMDDPLQSELRGMLMFGQGIARLRRGDLATERFRDKRTEVRARALALCLEDSKRWPEVEKAFRDAFDLLDKKGNES